MLLDSFIFTDQINILRGRLEYLNDIVDKFIIIESDVDFDGNSKPFYFLDNKHLYKKYEKKIIYVPVIVNRTLTKNKDIEAFQRNSVDQVLKNFSQQDLILIGNIDEIPDKNGVKLALEHVYGAKLISFNQQIYYGNFEHLDKKPHVGTVISLIEEVVKNSAQTVRNRKDELSKIIRGGWYLSQWNTVNRQNKKFIPNSDIVISNKIDIDQRIYHIFQKYQSTTENKQLSVIIPTMWKSDTFLTMLDSVVKNSFVNEVIIINNDVSNTPTSNVLSNDKIRMISAGTNIFVNPAWNYGASIAKYGYLLFLNDDIVFDIDIIDLAMNHITPTKIIALDVRHYNTDNVSDTSPEIVHFDNFSNAHNFGCFMMMCKDDWYPIPAGLNVYYGDMWMWDRIKQQYNENYIIKNAKVHAKDGLTANSLPNRREIYIKETNIVALMWQDLLNDSLSNIDAKKWIKLV